MIMLQIIISFDQHNAEYNQIEGMLRGQSVNRSINSPIIQRIASVHEKNKFKEITAQNTNKQYIAQFETKKTVEEKNRFHKNEKIMEKVLEQHKKLKETIKRKEDHFHKILKKSEAVQDDKYQRKVKNINERNRKFTVQRQNVDTERKIEKETVHNPSISPSQTFYDKLFNEELRKSNLTMQISEKKQSSAQKNRKQYEEEIQKLKERNLKKMEKYYKAEKDHKKRYNHRLKQSVIKIQEFLNRSQENKENYSEQRKKRRQREVKHHQKIKKSRENLLADLQDKLYKLQESIDCKSRRYSLNKEQLQESKIDKIKRSREEKEANTQIKFYSNQQKYNEKITTMYALDRQKWGFVTSITAFKENLIEKNIFESSQLSLQK